MVKPSYAIVGKNFQSTGTIELNISRPHAGQRCKDCLVFAIAQERFERKPFLNGFTMKAILFLFGFLALVECWASEPAPRLIGEKLVEYFYYPLDNFSDKDVLERAFAKGYLAGIADATQGKVWCITWVKKPDEIDADVFHALRKLPQERLREKASVLIIEIMGKKFPCK